MSKSNQAKNSTFKKSTRKEHKHLLSPQQIHHKPSPQHKDPSLFESNQLPRLHNKNSSMTQHCEQSKWHNKVMTTDESNNATDSKIQESVFLSDKRVPNDEYFHQPLHFKGKKRRKEIGASNRQVRQGKLQNISIKLSRINELVRSHEKELKEMRSSLSERELHRLIKIQSVQKLQLVEKMSESKPETIKRSKRL